jgi:CheY-like chemotaxis protein
MKLMIVDDHAGARQMIREMLSFPGVTLCECASGEEAVEKAREFEPDWITMDVRMPGLNGFQAATLIQEALPASRVVIVTTDNHPHLRHMARVVGAVAYFKKENLAELRELLADVIAKEKGTELS